MDFPDLKKLLFGAGSTPESDPETTEEHDPRDDFNALAIPTTRAQIIAMAREDIEARARGSSTESGDTHKEPPPDIERGLGALDFGGGSHQERPDLERGLGPFDSFGGGTYEEPRDIERVLGPFGAGTHTPDDLGEIVSEATQHTRDAVSETDLAPDWPTIDPHVSTALDPHSQDPWVTRHRVTPDGPAQPGPSPLDGNAQQAPPPFGSEPDPGGPESWGWDAPVTSDSITVPPPVASEPHPGATGSWGETDPGDSGSWEWDAPVTNDPEIAPAAPDTQTTSDGSPGFSAPC